MTERKKTTRERVADAIVTAQLVQSTLASPMQVLPPPALEPTGRTRDVETAQVAPLRGQAEAQRLLDQASDVLAAENERRRDAIQRGNELRVTVVEDPLARSRDERSRNTARGR